MEVILDRPGEISLGLPVLCFICNSSIPVTNGYSTYFTSVANGKILLADSIKTLSDLKIESEILDSSFLCKRCFSLFDELELTKIRCEELREKILDFFSNKTTKEDPVEQCDFLSLNSQESDFCCSSQQEVHNVEDKEDRVQDHVLLKETIRQVGLECPLCGRVFRRTGNLQSHLKNHGKQNTKLEKFPVQVTNDKELVLSDETRSSTGDVEGDPTRDEESGIENVADCHHMPNLKDLDTCEIDKKPRKKRQFEGQECTKKALYECKTCGKKWQRLRQLKIHENTHCQLRPFICEICGQAYKRKHALDVHVGMHKGINPFSCHVCGKVFTQKGALQRHIPLHTGEAPYQCEVCGKRFVHHTSFNMHKLAHTGAKTYKCEVCGLKLISGSHLKRHSRVHTGERPFACSHCNRKFAEKYNLMTHLRTHSNHRVDLETHKLHVCQVCGLNFVRKSKFEDHISMCHNKIIDAPKNPWIAEIFTQEELENENTATQPTSFTWSNTYMKSTSSILQLDY